MGSYVILGHSFSRKRGFLWWELCLGFWPRDFGKPSSYRECVSEKCVDCRYWIAFICITALIKVKWSQLVCQQGRGEEDFLMTIRTDIDLQHWQQPKQNAYMEYIPVETIFLLKKLTYSHIAVVPPQVLARTDDQNYPQSTNVMGHIFLLFQCHT